MNSTNIRWQASHLSNDDRWALLGQTGVVVWLTGLSGSGKSTIAMRLEERLVRKGAFAFVLDGDNVRHGLCGDLGFSDAARAENIRRVGEVAALFADSGCITISAFISPSRDVREVLKERIGPDRFVEIYVSTPLSVCEERDPKGLYARARAGEIANFTGIDSEYQPPLDPALSIDSSEVDVDEACRQIEMILGQGK